MARLLLTWIANSLAILAVGYLLGSISVESVGIAFLAGAILTLINAIVRPILVILTFPLTIVTLGLFYFVITGFCLWLTSRLVPGFVVHGAFMTILASILISFISAAISWSLRRAS